MSRPDFSRVWGSDNAPFTPIEASDYAAGWVFRTGAPPRRVNFDYFQNLSDQRSAWLGEQMLLAVGHEWQSDVTYDQYAVVRSPVNGQLYRSLAGSNLDNEPSVSGAQWALGVAQSADLLNTTRIDVASASTVNLTTAAPNTRNINITGTTTINGFTVAAGQLYFVRFNSALTLTNGAGLVTQAGGNIVTAAGDTCLIRATAANVVEVLCYVRGIRQALGDGQTWQNLTASRAVNTTYTNTTGRPIKVSIGYKGASGDENVYFKVNGVIVSFNENEGAGDSIGPVGDVVPAGASYVLESAVGSIENWAELR